MTGVQKIRGKVNVVLNGLVREGVIIGFRTSFGVNHGAGAPHVIVFLPEGRELDDVRALVRNALRQVGVSINVTAEQA